VAKPFFQVSDAHARDVGGVGLGLAICKSLVASMSGNLGIASKVGRGTRVSVVLPGWNEKAVHQEVALKKQQAGEPALLKRLDSLTSREREVLELLMIGHLNKAIAHRLGISTRTVETHRAHLMQKMRARSLTELVRIAMQAGAAAPS
jgi:two-component system response regulator FixJ